jgi:16S rRNA (guanine1516-N2)-methyltransferase
VNRFVVTTSRRPGATAAAEAEGWAERLGVRCVSRCGRSISMLCREDGVAGVLVISSAKPPTFVSADRGIHYFFHPGMALTRVRNIRRGMGDPMITAIELGEGDTVLDCTLGRGADAIVASYVVGARGRVVGLESSPLLAELTIEGLRTYEPPSEAVAAAMRAIDARQGDHLDFLQAAEARSFDVVYFDPIFGEPVEASSAMQPLRPLADDRPLAPEAVEEARRVARRAVVIKERPDAELWQQLGVRHFAGGKKSSIAYGIIAPTG